MRSENSGQMCLASSINFLAILRRCKDSVQIGFVSLVRWEKFLFVLKYLLCVVVGVLLTKYTRLCRPRIAKNCYYCFWSGFYYVCYFYIQIIWISEFLGENFWSYRWLVHRKRYTRLVLLLSPVDILLRNVKNISISQL